MWFISVEVSPHFIFQPDFILRSEVSFINLHFLPHLHQQVLLVQWGLHAAGLFFFLFRLLSILHEVPVVLIVEVRIQLPNLLFAQLQFELCLIFRRTLIHQPVIIPSAIAKLKGNTDYLHVGLAPVFILEPNLLLDNFCSILLQRFVGWELLVQLLHDQAGFVLH